MRRLLLAALASALVIPAAATAAEPIMPLADVHAGMRCTGLTVIRGTDIVPFDVEVLDVIAPERVDTARILIRVSGPSIDATGLGPGFSGSPVLCPDGAGVARNIGAISAGIGEYGGAVGLATPIEAILAEPVLPPTAAPRSASPRAPAAPVAPVAGSHPLAEPLTLAGVRPSLATMFVRAARKAGRQLVTGGAAPRAVVRTPQPLVPGAAVSVGLTSGDVSIGAIGTVAYADLGNIWIFGHSFDGAGRRSLFLQDAYIHTVVNNPLGAPELSTYKLGSPGNDVGTITSDGLNAVAGQLGALPPNFPLKVTARDRDTGKARVLRTLVADEGDVGSPAGPSALGLAGSAAVAESATAVLSGAPARQMAEMCVVIALRELKKPIRFCEHYAVLGAGPNALAGALALDFARAAELIDGYAFGVLHPTSVEVGVRVRRGLRQAYLVDADGPRYARRGRMVKLKLRLRRTQTGVRFTRTIRVRIPRSTHKGMRTIKLTGTDADAGSDPNDQSDISFIFEEEPPADAGPPQSVEAIRKQIEALERYDGVTATIGGSDIKAYRDPDLRISGTARVVVQIRR
jgi:hypothetical protein